MKIAFFGADGKVGRALVPVLERAGHEVRGIEIGEKPDVAGLDAAVDFTTPDAAPANVRAALDQGVSCVVGTTGWDPQPLNDYARERGLRLFVAPNFSLGAVLMLRFAEQAAQYFPRAEIIELHSDAKKDAPSGTARATADLIGARHEHPLRAASGTCCAPGGDLRGRGAAADDPARHDSTRVLRGRRAARAGEAARASNRAQRRPGQPSVNVVVLGGGSTGEHFVGALRRLDDEVEITLVESRLVGGECSYYACMPTKTMLRGAELSSSLDRAPGMDPQRPHADGVWSWRDKVASDWDDSEQLDWLEGSGAPSYEARRRSPGRVSSRWTGRSSLTIGSSSRPAPGRRFLR